MLHPEDAQRNSIQKKNLVVLKWTIKCYIVFNS